VRTRDWATVDFYAVLGVQPAATSDEIGVAFRALAKQLHPDRVGSEADSELFKLVTAAYEVLGDERLRDSYDAVRFDAGARQDAGSTTTITRPQAAPVPTRRAPLSPEVARRRARRFLAAGIAVFVAGLVVAALIVHLQVDERARRSGRVKTRAAVVVLPARTDLRFTTLDGSVVQVPEPHRVNPGTQRDGETVPILYRPDRPTDVLLVESTTARDLTLWFVAVKLLVGGLIFLVVGIRRLRASQR
jgi:hypothetical protein